MTGERCIVLAGELCHEAQGRVLATPRRTRWQDKGHLRPGPGRSVVLFPGFSSAFPHIAASQRNVPELLIGSELLGFLHVVAVSSTIMAGEREFRSACAQVTSVKLV